MFTGKFYKIHRKPLAPESLSDKVVCLNLATLLKTDYSIGVLL